MPASWQTAELPQAPDPNAERSPIDRGRVIFEQAGCQACHSVRLTQASPEAGGAVGPSFSNLGVRRKDAEWLRKQIIEPQSVAPGSKMPSFGHLSKEEMAALMAYLGTMDQKYDPVTEPNIQIPKRFIDELGPEGAKASIDKGMTLFNTSCLGCHIVGKVGGPLGPNLTHEALRGRSDEWQLAHLKDPLSVYVLGPTEGMQWMMPKFNQLSEEDLKALVIYLQSLY